MSDIAASVSSSPRSLPVRGDDDVARTQVGTSRGRAGYRRHNGELPLRVLDPDADAFILAGQFFSERRTPQRLEKNRVVVGQRFGHAARRAVVELAAVVVKRRHGVAAAIAIPSIAPCSRSATNVARASGDAGRKKYSSSRISRTSAWRGKCRVGFRIAVGLQTAAKAIRPQPGSAEEVPLRDDARAEAHHGDQGDGPRPRRGRSRPSGTGSSSLLLRFVRWFHGRQNLDRNLGDGFRSTPRLTIDLSS